MERQANHSMKSNAAANRYHYLPLVEDESTRDESSASHHVAHIPELLELVITELCMDEDSLAKLARVSPTFHEISIRLLWSGENAFQGSIKLSRLLELLPPGILIRPTSGTDTWRFRRGIKEWQWARFQHYSMHATSLLVSTPRYSPSLVALLGTRSGELFPRLRFLEVTGASNPGYLHAEWMLLAGPSLKELVISGDSPEDQAHSGLNDAGLRDQVDYLGTFSTFCCYLSERTPNVRRLDLSEFPDSVSIFPTTLITEFCAAVRSLSSLRDFRWESKSPIYSDVASMIATHQSLSKISLSPLDEWPQLGADEPNCPSVEKLQLAGTAVAIGACLRTIVDPLILSEVVLFYMQDAHQGPFHPFFDIFQATPNLRRIDLCFARHSITWEQLKPVLNCKALANLVIESSQITGFGDDAVNELASALPNLEILSITITEKIPRYAVSLYALVCLARQCPHLQELAIEVTTRKLARDTVKDLLELDRSIFRPLHYLDLLYSEINTQDDTPEFFGPRRTAELLSVLWPLIGNSGIQTSRSNLHNVSECWDQVGIAMRDME